MTTLPDKSVDSHREYIFSVAYAKYFKCSSPKMEEFAFVKVSLHLHVHISFECPLSELI